MARQQNSKTWTACEPGTIIQLTRGLHAKERNFDAGELKSAHLMCPRAHMRRNTLGAVTGWHNPARTYEL